MSGSIRVGLRVMSRVAAVIVRVIPSAFAYFNLIGSVDLREQGGYLDRSPGEIGVYVEDPQGWGGWYFNRE